MIAALTWRIEATDPPNEVTIGLSGCEFNFLVRCVWIATVKPEASFSRLGTCLSNTNAYKAMFDLIVPLKSTGS